MELNYHERGFFHWLHREQRIRCTWMGARKRTERQRSRSSGRRRPVRSRRDRAETHHRQHLPPEQQPGKASGARARRLLRRGLVHGARRQDEAGADGRDHSPHLQSRPRGRRSSGPEDP
ncbi:Heparanase-like protein 3 [Zea mays]|uniref:Heparanase-like protein 3 n=1 Tax=Zea mays TaxID=4577 RepID=A0A1D6QBZ6_MAIZE|nr:Heparanase-like protein 3 [Zea mays]